jgi:hypothetical protein
VAFDFSGSEETRLNLRVQVPIELDPTSPVPPDRPLMRSDGWVIDTDGNVHRCDTNKIDGHVDRATTTLQDALAENPAGDPVTSERHPYGSPFWQSPLVSTWAPSPVQVGHNEFEWEAIKPPPEHNPNPGMRDPNNYLFNSAQILGVHFQVGPPPEGNKADFHFAFCIRKLALLLEE